MPPYRHLPHLLHLLLPIILFSSCGQKGVPTPCDSVIVPSDTVTTVLHLPDTPTETKLRAMGLVDIQDIDSSIQVQLVYATPHNFMGRVLYKDMNKAFMLPQLAAKLSAAQKQLHSSHPHLNLIVLDAARPLSIQRQMFHQVQGTPNNIYVSNPLNGPGLHNYGAAIDISLIDTAGKLLPMGSDFARITYQQRTSIALLRSYQPTGIRQPLPSPIPDEATRPTTTPQRMVALQPHVTCQSPADLNTH